MLLLLFLETALCSVSPMSQNTLPKRFSCYFCVSCHRRRSWGRCWHEIWSTPSPWGYQDRRLTAVTFPSYRTLPSSLSLLRDEGQTCTVVTSTKEVCVDVPELQKHTLDLQEFLLICSVCSIGLWLCLLGAAAVQPPSPLFGHLYQYSRREHFVDCEFLSQIM